MPRKPENQVVIVDEKAPGFVKAQVKRIFWGVPAPPALSHLFRVPLTRAEQSLRFEQEQSTALTRMGVEASRRTESLDAGFSEVSGRLASLESLTSAHIAIDLAQLQTSNAIHGAIEHGFGNLQAISIEMAGLIADLSRRVHSGLDNISHQLANHHQVSCTQRINEGLGNLAMGKWDVAKACFERALQDWTLDPLVHYNLGLCSINDGDYEAAERHLMDALQIIQMNGDVLGASNIRRTLARLYRSMQEAGELVPPESGQELHLNHVEAEHRYDINLNTSIEELSRAVLNNPSLYEEQMSLICALIDSGNIGRATSEFSNLVFKNPEYRDRILKTSAGEKLRELFPNLFDPEIDLSDYGYLFAAIQSDLDELHPEGTANMVAKESAENLFKIGNHPDAYQPDLIVRAMELYYASGNKFDAMKAFATAYMTNYRIKRDDGTRDYNNTRNSDFKDAVHPILSGKFVKECLPNTAACFILSKYIQIPTSLAMDFEGAGYINTATRLAKYYIDDMQASEMNPYDPSSRKDLLYAIWRSGNYQLFASKLGNYVHNETLGRYSQHDLSSRVFLNYPSIAADPNIYETYGGIFENIPSEVVIARVKTLLDDGQIAEATTLFKRSLPLIHERKDHLKVYELVNNLRAAGFPDLFNKFVKASIPEVEKYDESHLKGWLLVKLHLDNGDNSMSKNIFYRYANVYYYHMLSYVNKHKDECPSIYEMHEQYKTSPANILRKFIEFIKLVF